MKKLITVLCLMITVAGAGQYPIYNRLPLDTTIAKYDTVAIVYLYTDTTVFCRDSIGNIKAEVGGRWFTYWDFGYEVRQEAGMIPVTSSENSTMYDWLMSYKFIGYLDRQKNPIRKGVIIWITKTIEK